ncbi:DoxX-like protein [Herbihabitans rhizosphaerae]|uniref:DoxX-like protein n=1 Tax=Herbihabitans rhizosphaerae TaxID=1872711 RepID=A0A4Q7KEZ8_9PSEU|nr:DoxX family protein [Herbihabitans rhizosphaerae]RZS32844.1 DoxX-like protein [Herbihabitans rhizosphaerae]
MSTAYVIVTIVGAVMVGFSAVSMFARTPWVVKPMEDYGVPESWLPWLGTAKAAGAAGLIVGLFVPAIGVAAAVCLVLYFIGAVITVIRAKWYSHIPFPLIYMAPAAVSLFL